MAARYGCRFEVRHVQGTAHPELREVADHLNSGSLLRVPYGSGHSCNGRTLFRRNIGKAPFTNIRYFDFRGFSIGKEKPAGNNDQQIHQNLPNRRDPSLSAWVAGQRHCGSF
ncbi:hypothetical protein [Saccharopolyspora sp. NPDC002578]